MSKFAHIQRGFDLTDGDIEAAVESREETKALLDQVARISAPNAGAAKLLLVFARLATTACEWMDGDLRIELVPAGDVTVFEVMTDLGGGMRERLFAPVAMNVPIDEYRRSVERLPQLIEPLLARNQEGGRLILTASADARRSSMPPASVHISQESLYGAAMPRAPTMPASHELNALPSIVETIKPPKEGGSTVGPLPVAPPPAAKGWRGFPGGGGPPPIPPGPPAAAAPAEPSPFRGMEVPERPQPSPFRGMDAPIPERAPASTRARGREPAAPPPLPVVSRAEAESEIDVQFEPTPEAPPVNRHATKARIPTPVMAQPAVKIPAKPAAGPPPIPLPAVAAPPPIPSPPAAAAPPPIPPPIVAPPPIPPAAAAPPIAPVPLPAVAVTPARPRMATIMGVAGPAGPFGINLPGVPPPIPAEAAAAPAVVPPPIPVAGPAAPAPVPIAKVAPTPAKVAPTRAKVAPTPAKVPAAAAKPPPIPTAPAAPEPAKVMLSEPPFDLDTLFSSVMPPAEAEAEKDRTRIQLITQPIPAPAKLPSSLMITPEVDEPFPMPLPATTASPPLPLVARILTPVMPKPLPNDAKTPRTPPVDLSGPGAAAKKGGRVAALRREEPESSPPAGGSDFPPLPLVGGTRRAPLPKLDPTPRAAMPRVAVPTDSEPPIPGVIGQRAVAPHGAKAMDVPTSKTPHVRGPATAGAAPKTAAASAVTSTKDLFDDQEPELEIDWGNSPPKPRR